MLHIMNDILLSIRNYDFQLLMYPIATITILFLLSHILSENRKKITYKQAFICILWQCLFGILLCKSDSALVAFNKINAGLDSIMLSTLKAMEFCFGGLANPQKTGKIGFILALQGFPILITISALSSILIYWRVLPTIIRVMSVFFRYTLGVGGTVGIATSTNLFAGMSETPLIIKPYLNKLSKNELFSVMACGAAGMAGSIMVIYSNILSEVITTPISHLLTAAIMNIPGSIAIASLIMPKDSQQYSEFDSANFSEAKNTLDAISTGIIDGGKVMIMVLLMIVGFMSLIDILNNLLGLLPPIEGEVLSLQRIFGIILAPISFMMGIPWEEAHIAGAILGTKIATNELLGFTHFVQDISLMSQHTQIITLYSIAGFANVGSIGVMLGIYSVLLPSSKKHVISQLTWKAVIAGTFSNCITASIAGAIFAF